MSVDEHQHNWNSGFIAMWNTNMILSLSLSSRCACTKKAQRHLSIRLSQAPVLIVCVSRLPCLVLMNESRQWRFAQTSLSLANLSSHRYSLFFIPLDSLIYVWLLFDVRRHLRGHTMQIAAATLNTTSVIWEIVSSNDCAVFHRSIDECETILDSPRC